MTKCEKGRLGYAKFDYEDDVSFYLTPYGETEEKFFTGKVYIVDRYGTFEQKEEPSYDIMVENYNNTGKNCLIKHVRESQLYI